jgi:asparagine synthetase B (glutamine-hydrolysing)
MCLCGIPLSRIHLSRVTCRNLFNKAELARNVLGVHTPLGEAQLLLQLYAAKGLDMLGMLNGQFAFCLYDSKQVCMCAALS